MTQLKFVLLVILIGVLACCVIEFAWNPFFLERSVLIEDVSKECDLKLERGKRSDPYDRPSGITLRVTGRVDGMVELTASSWERKMLSGDVNWSAYHDWFADECVLLIRPVGVAKGKLEIHYQFH